MQTDDARTRAFLAKVAAHDFEAAAHEFNDKMRAALPTDKLAAVWSKLETQAGAFERVESIEVKPLGDARVANAHSKFARATLVLRVVFDGDNRVTGFFVQPGVDAQAWQPPAYAKLDAFEERRVTIGREPVLPGTLTIPKGATHCPAIVLVHGSGPNDEDETIGPNKPFKDLAFGLASRGIVVLRYDKRTRVDPRTPATTKEESETDALAAVALLRAQTEVDPSRVALLGHSQGGSLAPRIAQADPTIKRLVILAGGARPIEQALVAQLRYLATLDPTNAKMQEAIADAERFKQAVESPTLRPDDKVKLGEMIAIPGSYFLDLRGYRPELAAARLAIPMLVLQGERDYNVTMAEDFAAWKSALGHKKNVTFKTYASLDHLFMAGQGPSSPADMEKLRHVAEPVVEDIAAWLHL